jgi:hypothetical protein
MGLLLLLEFGRDVECQEVVDSLKRLAPSVGVRPDQLKELLGVSPFLDGAQITPVGEDRASCKNVSRDFDNCI